MAIKSDAQRKAVAKYNAANYERIELRVKKEKKDAIKAHIAKHAIYKGSVNGFINAAIDSQMKLDERGLILS